MKFGSRLRLTFVSIADKYGVYLCWKECSTYMYWGTSSLPRRLGSNPGLHAQHSPLTEAPREVRDRPRLHARPLNAGWRTRLEPWRYSPPDPPPDPPPLPFTTSFQQPAANQLPGRYNILAALEKPIRSRRRSWQWSKCEGAAQLVTLPRKQVVSVTAKNTIVFMGRLLGFIRSSNLPFSQPLIDSKYFYSSFCSLSWWSNGILFQKIKY